MDRFQEVPLRPQSQPQQTQPAPFATLPAPIDILDRIKTEVHPRVEQLFVAFLVALEEALKKPVNDDLSFRLSAAKFKNDRPEVIELVLRRFGPNWVAKPLQGGQDDSLYHIELRPANKVSVATYLQRPEDAHVTPRAADET